jgi:hypothetical protein
MTKKTEVKAGPEACRCGHSARHHEEPGMFGCTAAIGLCRCACWGYVAFSKQPQAGLDYFRALSRNGFVLTPEQTAAIAKATPSEGGR